MDLNFIFNLAFIIPLIIIALYASYTDLKRGVIPNKLVLSGFAWGAFLYLALFLLNIFIFQSGSFLTYLPQALLNSGAALLVGYIVWSLGFWSAGDGKLFALYSFLLPLGFYQDFYINYFPAFALLVNLFVPLVILIGIKALFTAFSNRAKIKKTIEKREFLEPSVIKKYGKIIFVFVTDITMVMIIIRSLTFLFEDVLLLAANGFIIFGLLVALMYGFQMMKKKFGILEFFKYFIIFIFFGNLILASRYYDLLRFLRMIAVFAIFVGLLKYILLFYVRNEEIKKIKANEVQRGMILTKEWKEYFSEKISQLDKNDKHKHFESISGGGLSKRQAEIIRELFEDDDKYYIEICNTLPFAPFLLLAVSIALITKSSFIPMLSRLFNIFISF